jgi:hypothetical protein
MSCSHKMYDIHQGQDGLTRLSWNVQSIRMGGETTRQLGSSKSE